VHVEVTLGHYEGAEEFYRRLYGLHRSSSLEQMRLDFATFSEMPPAQQAFQIAEIIRGLAKGGEFRFVIDEGGVYTDEGQYQSFILDVMNILMDEGQPLLMFVQTRMMPYAARAMYPRAFHTISKHFLMTLWPN
jgi:hypothetical protein